MEERLLDEYRQLIKKIAVLERFLQTEEFTKIDEKQQKLLFDQIKVMDNYSMILHERIILIMQNKKTV